MDTSNQIKKIEDLTNTMDPVILQTVGVLTFMVILVVFLISIALKGYSLWHSAKNGQKWWFIALFIINSMGILEIIYLVFYKNKKLEVKLPSLAETEKTGGK